MNFGIVIRKANGNSEISSALILCSSDRLKMMYRSLVSHQLHFRVTCDLRCPGQLRPHQPDLEVMKAVNSGTVQIFC